MLVLLTNVQRLPKVLCKANQQGRKAWKSQGALLASGKLWPGVNYQGLRVSCHMCYYLPSLHDWDT